MGTVTNIEQLEALYGTPSTSSVEKEIDHINPHYHAYIEKSPFVTVATSGPEGLDCSPRGDAAGFVRIQDPKTLIMPDRRGNNRLDTLRNLIYDPRIGLLFLIPGVGITIRVNGTAKISVDPALLASFAVKGKEPNCVIIISVESVYLHCSRSILRSGIWDQSTQIDASALPSVGEIVEAVSKSGFDGKAYDKALPERLKTSLY